MLEFLEWRQNQMTIIKWFALKSNVCNTVASGWLNEQLGGDMFTLQAHVSHVFETMPVHTTYCVEQVTYDPSVWVRTHMWVDQQSLHSSLSSREESPPIALNAPVSEGNASSFGLLHSADNIVHIMDNWFYGPLQFAGADKNRFPRLFLFHSSLSLCHSNWMTPLTML